MLYLENQKLSNSRQLQQEKALYVEAKVHSRAALTSFSEIKIKKAEENVKFAKNNRRQPLDLRCSITFF